MKTNFLSNIDALRDIIEEEKVVELYSEAEEVFEEYEDKISDLKYDLQQSKDEVEEFKEKIESLEEEIETLGNNPKFTFENQIHDNIRTIGALEDVFKNLDYIPVEKIENLVKTHAAL